MSNIINKVKEVLHKDHTTDTTHTTHTGAHTTHTGTAEGVAGPHNSRIANAADPRVDSDLDGSRNVGASTGTTGYTGASTGTHTGAHTGTHTTHTGTAEGVAGPHSSRLANAADPRVDSDLDGSRNVGGTTGTSGYTGASTGTGTGYTGASTTGSTVPPHNSNLLNKLDPRVDTNTATSTHTGAHQTTGTTGGLTGTHQTTGTTGGLTGAHHTTGTTGGLTGTHHTTGTTGGLTGTHHNTGTTGGLSSSTNAGPHDSNLANKVDPRVDSDLDGRGNRVGAPTGGIMGASGSHATPGSGTAQNTAGPHNSDLANKLDPRVDSDMDGSRTAGNRTYQGAKDPKDAAHVPPSVLRQSIGDPVITHDGRTDHQARHGSVSDQVAHTGPYAS